MQMRDPNDDQQHEPRTAVRNAMARRAFIQRAGVGTALAVFGGLYTVADDGLIAQARAAKRPDGRPRLPPGQKLLKDLKPMGGQAGDPSRAAWRLKVHGLVDKPLELDYRALLKLPNVEQELDVHCVTGWTVLGAPWRGVRLSTIADKAKVKGTAKHVVFEAAHGYTANVRLDEALAPSVMLAHRYRGRPLAQPHGSPVRGVVPDLYFWKSPKWITGIKFVRRDEPGYWEVRGYNNHADPWLEERYA